MMERVTIARKNLIDALGENTKTYFQHMKLWFQMKVSKDDFDYESRKLLSRDKVFLHNNFLLALLQSCHGLAGSLGLYDDHSQVIPSRERGRSSHSSPSSRDRGRKNHSGDGQGFSTSTSSDKERSRSEDSRTRKRARGRDRLAFEPVELTDYVLPSPVYPPRKATGAQCIKVSANVAAPLTNDAVLPDAGLLLGRFLLAGWEENIEAVQEEATQYLSIALQQFLKSILVSVFEIRSGFRVREGKFRYAIGAPVANPWLKNTAHMERELEACKREDPGPTSQEDAEQRAAFELACGTSTRALSTKRPVGVFDLLHALKIHRYTIKSHTMYAVTMERTIARLNHLSHQELLAASIAS